ncbi:unnamed protein product [Mucor hiemalis]
MVITMGLTSAPKLKEVRESLSNRDSHTFSSLQKLLNVSMNMRYYRQKIQLAKSPAIPFLPVLLKDQTFFNENSTYSLSHPNLFLPPYSPMLNPIEECGAKIKAEVRKVRLKKSELLADRIEEAAKSVTSKNCKG